MSVEINKMIQLTKHHKLHSKITKKKILKNDHVFSFERFIIKVMTTDIIAMLKGKWPEYTSASVFHDFRYLQRNFQGYQFHAISYLSRVTSSLPLETFCRHLIKS